MVYKLLQMFKMPAIRNHAFEKESTVRIYQKNGFDIL